MRKLTLLITMLLMCGLAARSQRKVTAPIDSLDQRPLLFVNGKMVDAASFILLDRNVFKSLEILTKQASVKKYGAEAGKFGAVEIELLDTARLLTMAEIAQRFYFIPADIPTDTRIFYNYFVGLQLRDAKLFVASANKLNNMSLHDMFRKSRSPYVWIGTTYVEEEYKRNRTPSMATPFDKDIESIIKIFDEESVKRQEIESKKPVIRG